MPASYRNPANGDGSGPDFRTGAQRMDDSEKPYHGRTLSPLKIISPECCQWGRR